ncbi:hypothetical protein PJ900_00330 (plasmid) [Tistrella mobilis]|nr:hypothetical protein [Tistrella mobilis]
MTGAIGHGFKLPDGLSVGGSRFHDRSDWSWLQTLVRPFIWANLFP